MVPHYLLLASNVVLFLGGYMETIDNKYLIVIKSDGAIETIKSGEKDFDIQSKVLDLLERGSTVILNGEYQNDDLNRLIDPTYMFF